jgi:hypothetical protein
MWEVGTVPLVKNRAISSDILHFPARVLAIPAASAVTGKAAATAQGLSYRELRTSGFRCGARRNTGDTFQVNLIP